MSEQTQYAPNAGQPSPVPPPEYRRSVRSRLRHPLENLCLVLATLGTLTLWVFAGYEIASAIVERREPDTLALILALAPLAIYLLRGQLYARQRLNGVKIGSTQYPEAHQMVLDACAHYGLRKVPDAYVVLGNGMINAAASGHGFRKFIFVYSDLFEIGGQARDPEALRFIVGHEVGHIAAGHTSYWRLVAISGAQWIPFLGSTLSRSQEYTADNFGYALTPRGSAGAMATLAAGKYLNRSVDVNALADRATTERGFFVWLVNALATHPVLVWRSHALRDRRRPGRLLWRPRGLA
jgi:Zn-dependent protease with chaperone function